MRGLHLIRGGTAMPDTMHRSSTRRTWSHRITWLLFRHLPEDPYPSNHPTSLRRSPPDARG